MGWKTVIAGVGSLIALSGCAGQQYYHGDTCVTCFDNPVTGEPLNYDPEETPQKVATNAQGESVDSRNIGSQSGSIDISSNVDVDTAYARIKSSMGFRAPNDFEEGNTMSDWQKGDSAWKHQVTPGAHYDLGDYGRQTVGGKQYHLVQRVQIEKSGAGSRIHYSWAPADQRIAYDGKAMESALTQRLESALR
ncbi:hypothetical protein [Kushneria indalinina]|uniref:Lipoprotein n=1 Tax=Kushneria indalinina DSM 14324 TaxID=1122140 RepID=A0A3D9DRH8_9GAMM|nr:hypothetical protein [Kushneria indalinina]REC93343.1 hypothetical protein C8D72_3387 [Kushneria indalinina DSM 14324]